MCSVKDDIRPNGNAGSTIWYATTHMYNHQCLGNKSKYEIKYLMMGTESCYYNLRKSQQGISFLDEKHNLTIW